MRPTAAVYCITVTLSTAFAQNINLSGTVKNQQGTPVEGAVVTLLGKDLADTTGSNGRFELLENNVPVEAMSAVPAAEKVSLHGSMLELCIPEPDKVKIELFDVKGILLEKALDHHITTGNYRYGLMNTQRAAQMMFIRISVGGRVSTLRYIPVRSGRHVAFSSVYESSTGGSSLAKVQADVDSIEVAADGYETKVVAVSSYEDEIDITLEEEATSDLDPFSFFVTSLKAIQELSGSEDGFGGDLRFGKTGQGAGLLGADSICECIAEMSMPGSKVKQWRAFLSVSAGPDGNQVDARDRIGDGPWYDRLGRLLAPTLDDLINDRPQNGDSEIQNDLPNEWGVPNHRPDPTQPEEDNHHMITGSDKEGRLYSRNATCDDWTNVNASGKPRCGFSWPRFMMRKTSQWGDMGSTHWISDIDVGGCKAGIHVSTSFDSPSDIIGWQGGYGGFYCFALSP